MPIYNVAASIASPDDDQTLTRALRRVGFDPLEDAAPGSRPERVAVWDLIAARSAERAARRFGGYLNTAHFNVVALDAYAAECDLDGNPLRDEDRPTDNYAWEC